MLKRLHSEMPTAELLIYPSDEFGGQELPTADIPAFVKKAGLPVNADGCRLMAKVNTNGAATDPVWSFAKAAFPGDGTSRVSNPAARPLH